MEGGDIDNFAARHGLPAEALEELTQLLQSAVVSQKKRVYIRVPATIGNLGPGLDCFGLAVDIWDEFLIENATQFSVDLMGEAAVAHVPRDETNLVVRGADVAFKMAGKEMPPLHFRCDCRIPSAKGLGSEAAAFIAGFIAGFILSGNETPRMSSHVKNASPLQTPAAMLRLKPSKDSSDIAMLSPKHGVDFDLDESSLTRTRSSRTNSDDLPNGHGDIMPPDEECMQRQRTDVSTLCVPCGDKTHVSPKSSKNEMTDNLLLQAMEQGWSPGHIGCAVHGGAQITLQSKNSWECHRVPFPPGLVCIIFCPDERKVSGWADKSAPGEMVARSAAVFNVGRVGLLVNSFITGDFRFMRAAMEDRLHQPKTMSSCPHIASVIQAAYDAGADGSSVSGAGPSVVAFLTSRSGDIVANAKTNELEHKVAEAMLAAADNVGVTGRILISKPVDSGAHISAQRSDISGASARNIQYFQ